MDQLLIVFLIAAIVFAVAAFFTLLILKNRAIKRSEKRIQELTTHNENIELAMQAAGLSMWVLDVQQRCFEFDFRFLDIKIKDRCYKADLTRYYHAVHPDDVERIQTAYYNILNNVSNHLFEEYRIILPGETEYSWLASFAKVSKRDFDNSPLVLIGASVIVDEWHLSHRTK